ncbi:protein of unknown function [Azospirillum baldaniorum]|uniref:Uncharacterized protein n=1 Tax=Azospirillum baldaniorum TaxID=1064539 RepID=A0A9P1JSU9_9PROT|nr:protein of unknown function [Azospirillum baldaniorum]
MERPDRLVVSNRPCSVRARNNQSARTDREDEGEFGRAKISNWFPERGSNTIFGDSLDFANYAITLQNILPT